MKRPHLVLAIALSTGLIATAYAAIPGAQAPGAPTAAELGLEARHVAAWDALRDETNALREAARNEARRRLQQADTLLASDSADLRAFSADIDREIDDYLARSRALRDRKLAFYESLDASEQSSARALMRSRIERAERLRSAFATLLHDAY